MALAQLWIAACATPPFGLLRGGVRDGERSALVAVVGFEPAIESLQECFFAMV
jgi:hypothetical protein